MGFEVVSWLREWRRDQRRAGVDANACCKVVKRRDQVKILVAEVRRISSRGRIHLKSVNERANRGIAGTEGLNGGRRHACAAGSGKQASTSTHTSSLTLYPRYYLRICHTIFSKASKDAEWYCPAFLALCILIGWRLTYARYEDANATGGGAELVEGTVKSMPTCMSRGDKNIVPGYGGSA